MRPLWFFYIGVVAIVCGGKVTSAFYKAIFVRDGKEHLSLCFRAIFHTKRKVPTIIGAPRLQKRNEKPKKQFRP
jgi:hypothetical protein